MGTNNIGLGRHTLKTANIPILTKILSLPWGTTSPLRAEVYFTNMKVFPNLKWGTRDPVAFRDAELGLIRLRAFGVFNLRVIQPVFFINSLVGTQGMFTTEEIEEYLNRVIVSRFNDFVGESIDTIFNLPARYNELSEELKKLLPSYLLDRTVKYNLFLPFAPGVVGTWRGRKLPWYSSARTAILWSCPGTVFDPVSFIVMAPGADGPLYYLPFWRLKVTIEGIKLASYADLIRVGNLPRAITDVCEEKTLYFWFPAFKVNPALFLRWARQMTVFQPEGKTDDTLPNGLYPVTLPVQEALESAKIIIASITADKRAIFPLLSKIQLRLEESHLVYHPFTVSHHELIHTQMHLSIDKKALTYGIGL
ncbi:MAG: SPFH domain-containing protein [Syntrophales bacterium]|nr:SPFH domain-containing protein [Syntrophales bacterium]